MGLSFCNPLPVMEPLGHGCPCDRRWWQSAAWPKDILIPCICHLCLDLSGDESSRLCLYLGRKEGSDALVGDTGSWRGAETLRINTQEQPSGPARAPEHRVGQIPSKGDHSPLLGAAGAQAVLSAMLCGDQ